MDKELIKEYFKMKLFTEEDLEIFVKSGDITEEEKKKMVNDN